MPRKKASDATEPPKSSARAKTATKTTRTPKTSAEKPAPARTTRKAAPRTRSVKPGLKASSNGHGNGVTPGKTARDYADAKRALGALWEDITKQTYSTFDSITKRVEKSYEGARKNVTEGDVHYALEKTQGKLKAIANSSSHMVRNMAKQAKLLYEMLRDAKAGKFKMPWVTVAAITAALLYLVSPLDVIPDFIPGIGWMDDALVISLAIAVARVDLRRYIAENKLNAADYGL